MFDFNKFLKSFKYAFEGIINTIKKEQNIKVHIFVMCIVIIAGFYFKISKIEWIICLILFGMVIGAELINTAIENAVDLITSEKNEKAKLAKDAAAGAVLVISFFAAIIGIMIFGNKIL